MTAKRKPNELDVPCHDLTWFDWNQEDGTLTAEASDLGRGKFWSRLYNDACDEGMAIYSPKTGRTERFFLHETHRDQEGDVTKWVFKPVYSLGTVSEVIVFND